MRGWDACGKTDGGGEDEKEKARDKERERTSKKLQGRTDGRI